MWPTSSRTAQIAISIARWCWMCLCWRSSSWESIHVFRMSLSGRILVKRRQTSSCLGRNSTGSLFCLPNSSALGKKRTVGFRWTACCSYNCSHYVGNFFTPFKHHWKAPIKWLVFGHSFPFSLETLLLSGVIIIIHHFHQCFTLSAACLA